MNTLIEDRDFLTESQQQFIDAEILGPNFPFYWNDSATHEPDNCGFMVHTVLNRPEVRTAQDTGINSDYHDFFVEIFNSFCLNNQVSYREILRIAVNMTMHNGIAVSRAHTDHNFPHRQCLLYLNDSPTSLTTILEEDGKTVWKEIRAERFKAVCFPDRQHYVHLPREGRRVVVVYTFT